jgi:hypothetical protein
VPCLVGEAATHDDLVADLKALIPVGVDGPSHGICVPG